MSDQSSKFGQMTFAGIGSTTSLQGSADSVSPCASPDGQTTGQSSPEAAPVRVSPRRAQEQASTIRDTFGRRGFGSSASCALQQSLESRLKRRLDSAGSILFSQSWKQKVTPAGRLYLGLAVSALRTSGSGFTGWPTAQSRDGHGGGQARRYGERSNLDDAAQLAAWPTPNAGPQNDGDSTRERRREVLKNLHKNGNGFGLNLGQAATLAGWPTPMAGTPAQNGNSAAGNTDSSRKTVALLAGWPTPNTPSGGRVMPPETTVTGKTPDGRKVQVCLENVAALAGWGTPRAEDAESSGMRHSRGVADTLTAQSSLAGWATPTARDYRHANAKPGPERGRETKGEQLPNQAKRLAGPMPSGFPAATESCAQFKGQLNPALSRWLQGFPIAWDVAGLAAWRSMRRSSKKARPGQ